jgi:hypothetical protein
MVIGADGATDLIGPYTSEARATRDAERIRDEAEGVSADVYLMDQPRYAGDYISKESRLS